LIFASNKWGFGNWREVRIGIKKEDSFEFDSYFKSRTESELNKRMASLLRVIKAEQDYEARLQYYKKQEEGVLRESTNGKSKARLSGVIEVEDDNHSFIEDVEIENASDAQDSGIKVSSKENYKKKKTLPSEENGSKAKNDEAQENGSIQLKKRKPERSPEDTIKKPTSEKAKQQTLSNFFGSN
jgi:hypothetical protein